MYTSSSTMFPRMKQKPSSVTRFGASQSGSSSTKAFHCAKVRRVLWVAGMHGAAYVVL